MPQTAANIWADGPATLPQQPAKSEIRDWGTWVESIISAFLGNGGLVYTSRASLFADLAHGANSSAWVIGDPNVAYNGVYMKSGSSGTGSWTRVSDLPFSFIIASDTGAGTPNAIQATSSIPISASALVVTNVFEINDSSPVTISFNGGPNLTIKSNDGSDIVPNGLPPILFGFVQGANFRCINDVVSSAIVAAAQAQANAAAASATLAASYAAGVNLPAAVADTFLQQSSPTSGYVTRTPEEVKQIVNGIPTYATTTALSAATIRASVQVVRVASFSAIGDGGGHQRKRVTAQPAWGGIRSTDRFLPNGTTDATNGGWWDVDETVPNEAMFGAVASATNAVRTAAIQALFDHCGAALPRKKARIIGGHTITAQLNVPDFMTVDFDAGGQAGGAAIINKGFNGTMMTLGNAVRLNNVVLNGKASAGFTGDGIKINTGGDQILDNPFMTDMAGACLLFNTGGQGIRFRCIGGFLQSSQSAGANYAVVLPATEPTTTGFRHFIAVHSGGTPFIDLKNGDYTILDGCVNTGVNFGNTTTGRTKILNCRIADPTGVLIFGMEHVFAFNHVAGPVTLGAGSQLCKVFGNVIAGGGSPTNSGNVNNQIV